MAIHPQFDAAVKLIDAGHVEQLRELLSQHPELAVARDSGNASLLIRLIDWPGCRPRSPETARVLVEAGVAVDDRRDDKNGTALAGALCTGEFEVVRVLLESGADPEAPLGWMPGTNFDLADRMCQGLDGQRDEKIQSLAKMYTAAAGRKIPSRAPFGGSISLLFVSNVEAGQKFYERLGFHVNWSYGESSGDPYVSMSRGNTEFHLTGCECADKRHVGNLWARVACDLIDDLFAECRAADIKTLDEPTDQPWGFREFDIEDPEGNRLTFYGPTTEQRAD